MVVWTCLKITCSKICALLNPAPVLTVSATTTDLTSSNQTVNCGRASWQSQSQSRGHVSSVNFGPALSFNCECEQQVTLHIGYVVIGDRIYGQIGYVFNYPVVPNEFLCNNTDWIDVQSLKWSMMVNFCWTKPWTLYRILFTIHVPTTKGQNPCLLTHTPAGPHTRPTRSKAVGVAEREEVASQN